uniref:chromodomain-helicase-DNA-binding protein 2-like isoform X3 n=1 Tax=Styela clava TaxID=7725 RepID=UPI00193938BA|nr:chromodomain-helicase-DNA-binding protein 2-like isoform X3 [Styela clava]
MMIWHHRRNEVVKIKSKARVEINDDSDAEPGSLSTPMVNTTTSATKKDSSSRKMQKKPKSNAKNSDNTKENHSNQNTVNNKNSTETKNRKIKRKHKTKENEKLKEEIGNTHSNDKKKSEKHKTERKASDGPVHITAAADPVPIAEDEFSGELDLDTFKDCKERMRPVKKALKLLDKPPSGTNNDEKAQAEHMKNCILKIGDRVLECLKECHGDLVAIKTWRRNLWIFVSKFTEFNAQRLHKVYKRASRKREQERDKNKVKHSHLGSGDHSTHRNTSDSKFEKNSNSSPRKNVAGKKRNHSPIKNRGGAGDGPTTAPKRSFNTSESRHRERVPPHPANRKGENFHESSTLSLSKSNSEVLTSQFSGIYQQSQQIVHYFQSGSQIQNDRYQSGVTENCLSQYSLIGGTSGDIGIKERYSPSHYSLPNSGIDKSYIGHYNYNKHGIRWQYESSAGFRQNNICGVPTRTNFPGEKCIWWAKNPHSQ